MFGADQSPQLPLRKWLAVGVACVSLALSISLTCWVFGADSSDKRSTAGAPAVTKFQFARMQYPGGIPDYVKNWYTDYPNMDKNLTALMRRLTEIDLGAPVVFEPSKDDIFQYPLIYSVEPEQMILGERDITNLREYLNRGGLWFADDFHGDEEYDLFLQQIRRVLPEASPVELDTSHPLFHCFYDIDKIVQVTNDSIAKCTACEQWENGLSGKVPKVFAVFDQKGRIKVLMAWNTDLGDGLEWADDPEYPAYYSTYAFKFVSNVIVYAMSH